MAKSKIEKRNQNVEDFFEQVKTYYVDKLTGVVPFGDELNLILNARSNIRKERVIRFFEKFRDEMQRVYGKPLDQDDITSEEFIDVMEAIMLKVQSTQSLYKVDRFRNMLVKQVVDPIDNQLTLKYIDMVGDLTDVQLIMLKAVSNKHSFRDHWELITTIWKNYNPNSDIRTFNHQEPDFNINFGETEISIIKKEIQFYLVDLIIKGLIVDSTEEELSIPNMRFTQWPTNSGKGVSVTRKKKEQYAITSIGKNLIAFIETPN